MSSSSCSSSSSSSPQQQHHQPHSAERYQMNIWIYSFLLSASHPISFKAFQSLYLEIHCGRSGNPKPLVDGIVQRPWPFDCSFLPSYRFILGFDGILQGLCDLSRLLPCCRHVARSLLSPGQLCRRRVLRHEVLPQRIHLRDKQGWKAVRLSRSKQISKGQRVFCS